MLTEQEQLELDNLGAIVSKDGFMKLKSPEKKRYQELKHKVVEDATPVSMTRGDLKQMIEEAVAEYKTEVDRLSQDNESMGEVKKFGEWIKSKKPKQVNKTAKLRVFRLDGDAEPGVVTNMKYLRKAFNEDSRKYDIDVYKITVHYEAGEKDHEIALADLMTMNEFETVELTDIKVEEQEMSQGEGQKPYSKSGYAFSAPGMFGTKDQLLPGETFDYIVKRKEVTCVCKRPNGQYLSLSASKFNQ